MDTFRLCSPTRRQLKARVCRITAQSTNMLSFLFTLGKSCAAPCWSSCQPMSWGWIQQRGPCWPCLLHAAQAGHIFIRTKFRFLLGANQLVRIFGEISVLTLITTPMQSSKSSARAPWKWHPAGFSLQRLDWEAGLHRGLAPTITGGLCCCHLVHRAGGLLCYGTFH